MSDLPEATPDQINEWLAELRRGDENARASLLGFFGERLKRFTRKMLRGFPDLKRWLDSDDVYQGAMVRLLRALKDVQVQSAEHFFHLAAQQIRRELLDLARQLRRPGPLAGGHASRTMRVNPVKQGAEEVAEPEDKRLKKPIDGDRLAAWCEFQALIDELPEEERDLFDRLWVLGLDQTVVANQLGMAQRTLTRRWKTLRTKIQRMMQNTLPDDFFE